MKPNLGTLLNFDNPLNQGLVTCFPNSEQSGEAVYDISKYGYKGTLFGNAWTLPSVEYDRYALDYNGSSNVVITDINNTVTEATFTAWVKADVWNAWAGIMYSRGSDVTGIMNGSSPELRYIWNNNEWGWSSGLTLPTDKWVFVAVSISPESATAYVIEDNILSSAINIASHAATTIDALILGWDESSGTRIFDGLMGESRIYLRPLIESELRELYTRPDDLYVQESDILNAAQVIILSVAPSKTYALKKNNSGSGVLVYLKKNADGSGIDPVIKYNDDGTDYVVNTSGS